MRLFETLAIRQTADMPMFTMFVLEGPSNFGPQFLDFRPREGRYWGGAL